MLAVPQCEPLSELLLGPGDGCKHFLLLLWDCPNVIVEAVPLGCIDFPFWPECSHSFEWSTYAVSLSLDNARTPSITI